MANGGVIKGLEGKIRNAALVNAREVLGLTQGEAAEKIGIGKASLLNYENTKSYPSHTAQKKICNFYSQNGYSLNEKDTFPEYMEVIATRHREKGYGNGIPTELIVPLSSVNESYQINNDKMDAKIVINELLKDLTGRCKGILTMRYGLEGDDPKPLVEVAKEYNITRERVRQIEASALKELRKKAYDYMRKDMA